MLCVSTEIIIELPLAQVVAYVSNPDNAPHWYRNIKSVKCAASGPLEVGTEIAFVTSFMGEMTYTYRITELSENRLVMETDGGLFPMQTVYEWEAIDSWSTKMRLLNSGTPTGLNRLLSPVLSFMVKRANLQDLERLKCILEKGTVKSFYQFV